MNIVDKYKEIMRAYFECDYFAEELMDSYAECSPDRFVDFCQEAIRNDVHCRSFINGLEEKGLKMDREMLDITMDIYSPVMNNDGIKSEWNKAKEVSDRKWERYTY